MLKTKRYSIVLVYAILFLSTSTKVLPSDKKPKNKVSRSYTITNLTQNTMRHHSYSPKESPNRQDNTIDKLEENKDQLKRDNEKLELEIKDLKQEVKDLTNSNDSLKLEVGNRQREINNVNEQKERIEKHFNEVSKENKDLQSSNNDLTLQVERLKKDLNLYTKEQERLANSNKELLNKIEKLQEEFYVKNDSVAWLKFIDKNNHSRTKLRSNPNQALRMLQNEIQRLEERNNNLAKRCDELYQAKKTLKEKNKELISISNEENKAREKLESENSDLVETYNNLLNDYSSLKQSYEEEQKTNQSNDYTYEHGLLQTQKTMVHNVHFRDETIIQSNDIKDNKSDDNDFHYNMNRIRRQSLGDCRVTTNLEVVFTNSNFKNEYESEGSMQHHTDMSCISDSLTGSILPSSHKWEKPTDIKIDHNPSDHTTASSKKTKDDKLTKVIKKPSIQDNVLNHTILPERKQESNDDQKYPQPKYKEPLSGQGNKLKISLVVMSIYSIIITFFHLASIKKEPPKKQISKTLIEDK